MIDIDYSPIETIVLGANRPVALYHARRLGMQGPTDKRFFLATTWDSLRALNGCVLSPDVNIFTQGYQPWYPEARALIRSRQR